MFHRLVIFGAFLTAAVCAYAAGAAIEGTVRGSDGKPMAGAEIRLEGKGQTAVTTTTDRRGQYHSKHVPAGIYKISVVSNGVVQVSQTIKTAGENRRLDFELKPTAKKVKQYVWVPARTGSHMGGGWVEVDSSGNPEAGDLNVQRASAEAVQDMQRNMGRGMLPGGR